VMLAFGGIGQYLLAVTRNCDCHNVIIRTGLDSHSYIMNRSMGLSIAVHRRRLYLDSLLLSTHTLFSSHDSSIYWYGYGIRRSKR
jgi:hypothetical protein